MRNDQPVIAIDDRIEFRAETRHVEVAPPDAKFGKGSPHLLPITTMTDKTALHVDSLGISFDVYSHRYRCVIKDAGQWQFYL
jgi:hypothetical protein